MLLARFDGSELAQPDVFACTDLGDSLVGALDDLVEASVVAVTTARLGVRPVVGVETGDVDTVRAGPIVLQVIARSIREIGLVRRPDELHVDRALRAETIDQTPPGAAENRPR